MKAKAIKGYPVVSFDDGSLLGRVQDLIVDPAEKKVAGLLVGEKGFIKGKMQFIPFPQVLNIGKDVLIIKSKEGILSEEEQLQGELFYERSIIGHSVISAEGDYIGKIQDFTFSKENGALESLLLADLKTPGKGNKNVYLDIGESLKLGKDYVIVGGNYTSFWREEDKEEEEQLKSPLYSLEVRAIEFALGKEAAHTVKDIHGEVIIEKGEKVTPEIIHRARAKGRLYQLLFAAGVGELLESIDFTVEKLDKGSALLLQAWQSLKDKSRYILKGPSGEEEKKKGEDKSAPAEQEEAEEILRGEEEKRKTSLPADLFENIREIVSRLEEEISRGGKELARESGEMMKKFILHKKAGYAVRDNEGNPLVEEGGEITEEILRAAERQNKLPALFLSVAAQEVEKSLNIIEEKIKDLFR